MPAQTGYRAPSVGRALKILELVAQSRDGIGISELSRHLGISKGTVFGLCKQLEAGGALSRDPSSKRYGLGPLVATLARRGFAQASLRDAAGPEMTRLCSRLDESVFLGVMGRGEVMVVEARQPPEQIRISAGPGTRLPLLAGAVGKVFLAGQPPAVVDKILAQGLPRHTPNSVVDLDQYLQQLEQVREQGYAVEQDEYLNGIWGVAVLVGSSGGLASALYVVGFTSSLTPGHLDEVVRETMESARSIRQNLH
ncbi:MAG: IclR family transcriptional regulator [Proteobacteria bacterium]|nr:IclR family transcriptional regulator [Pseudomonadota bacterium]MBU4275963.1 IclR family transcriptional regulator [Pseudomonadota bacterium]MBU4383998.1 IclR family transcriptional regulator [Pseudomonadota bacterium]MBU4606453.1 IclR family transcriptional regulator [Pseudomonadota bacterium]MCG2763637.1 IclR family transcriptional regulator [Desulfarculaceae bacterium]